MDIGKIIGKWPWMSKISLQGNGMAVITKTKSNQKFEELAATLISPPLKPVYMESLVSCCNIGILNVSFILSFTIFANI